MYILHITKMFYNAYNLVPNKKYKFMIRYNLEKNIDDKLPHYYTGTYIGHKQIRCRKQNKCIWIFLNLINQETKNVIEKIEIKYFGLMYPSIELFIDVI
jgi:hypothetical protein